MKTKLLKFLKADEGASAIEYALLAAMVALALVTFVPTIRGAITTIFTSIQTALGG